MFVNVLTPFVTSAKPTWDIKVLTLLRGVMCNLVQGGLTDNLH